MSGYWKIQTLELKFQNAPQLDDAVAPSYGRHLALLVSKLRDDRHKDIDGDI